jgi:hypothetical protein
MMDGKVKEIDLLTLYGHPHSVRLPLVLLAHTFSFVGLDLVILSHSVEILLSCGYNHRVGYLGSNNNL